MWVRLPPLLSDSGGGHGALTSSCEARADDGEVASYPAPVIRQATHFFSPAFGSKKSPSLMLGFAGKCALQTFPVAVSMTRP